jgi:hypothetical protein
MLTRSTAFCLGMALGAAGCSNQIVLGDGVAGTGSMVAGGAGSATSGGTSSAAGTSAGLPDPLIPAPGALVWSTDHELGDWSDWQRGGEAYGGEYEWGDFNAYVDIGVGRDGSQGVVIDINTMPRSDTSSGVRLYRRIDDGPAYYSAWFRLDDAHTVSNWWSIFLFNARDDSLSLFNDVSLWDVRVVDTLTGEMALQFFDHDVMQGTLAGSQANIAIGEWFEIRAYLDYHPPDATRLAIWLDETLLFDMKQLHTAVQTNVFWAIGNGAAELDPVDSTLRLDDAAIRKASAP